MQNFKGNIFGSPHVGTSLLSLSLSLASSPPLSACGVRDSLAGVVAGAGMAAVDEAIAMRSGVQEGTPSRALQGGRGGICM